MPDPGAFEEEFPAARVRETLKEHYLAEMVCDHETRMDKPGCWCSLEDLGWHPSIGEAVDAWIEHFMEQLNLRPGIDRPLRPGEENPWAKHLRDNPPIESEPGDIDPFNLPSEED